MTMIFSFLSSTFGVACVSVARYTRPCGISGRRYAQKGTTTASARVSRCVGVHEMQTDTTCDTVFLQNPKDYVTNDVRYVLCFHFEFSGATDNCFKKGAFVGGPTRNIDETRKKTRNQIVCSRKKNSFDFFLFLVFGRKAHKGIKGINLCAKRQYGGKHTDPCASRAPSGNSCAYLGRRLCAGVWKPGEEM